MTLSSSPVTYTVTYTSGTITTGTVTNTTLAKLSISTDLVVADSSYQNRNKGIHVSANSEISVLLINYQPNTIGDYFAYPHVIQNLTLAQYQYYAVSTGSLAVPAQSLSEVLLVGTEDNTAVTVVPTQNIAVPNIQFSNSPEINVTAGTPFSFALHKMQTFLFGAPLNDITGTSIVSDKPLTVISGHECGNVPDNVPYCQHITEQIPPTVNWGQQFLLTPYSGKPVQYYKIITAANHTTYNFTCGRYNTTTHYLNTAGSSFTHSTSGSSYCSISSDKPILVSQLGAGYDLGNTGDPVISIVPSVDQYSKEIVFVSPNMNGITSHYVNIATTSLNTILVNGIALTLTWNAIYDHTNNVIGYGTQLNSNSLDISHILTSHTKFSTLVYGFGFTSGYSYSAGVNLTQGIIKFHSMLPVCVLYRLLLL